MSNEPTESAAQHVVEQLLNKTWEELEVLEIEGRILFPEKMYRRNKTGAFDEIPVRLRVLREPEIRQATVEARKIALNDGLDLDRDRLLVENIQVMCELAIAVRDDEPPYAPFDPYPAELEKHYDRETLLQLYEKLDRLTLVMDPRSEQISEDEIIALASAISERRNIYPLAVYGPGAQSTFIVYMADQLVISLASRLSSDSSEGSIQVQ